MEHFESFIGGSHIPHPKTRWMSQVFASQICFNSHISINDSMAVQRSCGQKQLF